MLLIFLVTDGRLISNKTIFTQCRISAELMHLVCGSGWKFCRSWWVQDWKTRPVQNSVVRTGGQTRVKWFTVHLGTTGTQHIKRMAPMHFHRKWQKNSRFVFWLTIIRLGLVGKYNDDTAVERIFRVMNTVFYSNWSVKEPARKWLCERRCCTKAKKRGFSSGMNHERQEQTKSLNPLRHLQRTQNFYGTLYYRGYSMHDLFLIVDLYLWKKTRHSVETTDEFNKILCESLTHPA